MSNTELASARVYREYVIENNRRVDLVIETSERFIPIEVKINAVDQENQCYDYYQKARNSKVFYLTCFGENPSEYSASGLTKNNDGYDEVACISFAEHILGWLNECLKELETLKITAIREIILQLISSIKIFTDQMEDGKVMEIYRQILSSKDNLSSAIDIDKALPRAKATIIQEFMDLLTEKFVTEGFEVIQCDNIDIENYYTKYKRINPWLTIILKRFSDELIASFNIEISYELYYYFAFLDSDLTCYGTDEVKIMNNPNYNLFVNTVNDVMKCEGKKTDAAFYWMYLYDSQNLKYDFKSFSDNCIDLLETKEYETERMVSGLSPKLSDIIKRLNKVK